MRHCPFHGCEAFVPDHIFACRKHWYQLLVCDRWKIGDAYAAYKRGELTIEALRELQQKVLGTRGTA